MRHRCGSKEGAQGAAMTRDDVATKGRSTGGRVFQLARLPGDRAYLVGAMLVLVDLCRTCWRDEGV